MSAKLSSALRALWPRGDLPLRAARLLCIGSAVGGVLLLAAGLFAADLRNLLAGLILLSLTVVSRRYLRQRAEFARTAAVLEAFVSGLSAADPRKAAHLAELLRRWEKLESQRGSPAFDPWALLSVHHDIQRILREDPALHRLFRA